MLGGWNFVGRWWVGYTGVWVDADETVKLAAMGVRVDGRGISQHGFALNVNPDLSFFEGIVPCGIHERGVSSMARLLGRPLEVEAAAPVVAEEFGREFGLEWERVGLEQVEGML